MKNSDIISKLPENITESILARLPIRDVVRTSVLSRNWRYKWITLPDLVFDARGIDRSTFYSKPEYMILDEDKLVQVIYKILLQHKGPIHKFSLSVQSMRKYSDVDQWINFLSRNGIREFILEFFFGNRYKIHSRLFSCVNLKELRLRTCIIPSLPLSFKGFNDLTFLKLDSVTVNNEGFTNLIAKCPKLYNLILNSVDGLIGLHIDYAPKLQTLHLACRRLIYICLRNTPSLLYASIYFFELPDMNETLGNGESISLLNNLNFLSNLRSFVAGSYFLKFLGQGSVRKLLPSTSTNLRIVHFYDLKFEDIDSLSSVLSLITNSPNLQKLIVSDTSWPRTMSVAEQVETLYLEGDSGSIGCLRKLKYVEMENITGVGTEMEFIKLILSKSPSLKQMKIKPHALIFHMPVLGIESKILKDLIRFPRASKMAEIIYEGHQLP
ncbi:hypothetical protein REPUB_Repub01dG0035700 [Reevesia pubescens]